MPKIVSNPHELFGFHSTQKQVKLGVDSQARIYTVFVKDDYSGRERLSAFFTALLKTLRTCGFALKYADMRESWSIALTGRVTVWVSSQIASLISKKLKLTEMPSLVPLFGAQSLLDAMRAERSLTSSDLKRINHFTSDFLLNLLAYHRLEMVTLNFFEVFLSNLVVKNKILITPTIDIYNAKQVRSKLNTLLEFYTAHLNLNHNLPKTLFIPTLTTIGAITVVIEPELKQGNTKITVIDLSEGKDYQKELNTIIRGLKDFYSSKKINVVKYKQSSNSKISGYQQVQNILLLAGQSSKQTFVNEHKLPQRSHQEIEQFMASHSEKIEEASKLVNSHPDSKGILIGHDHFQIDFDLAQKYHGQFQDSLLQRW